ncbi:MAG: putative metal-binding motif-containing protein [Sandaracinaceae bacterium]|nr:putative metal-binding motif-containing protein [Sandaracinaceae bacterium]
MRHLPLILVAGLVSACSVIAGGGEPSSWRCTMGSDDLCQEIAPAGENYRCVIPPGESEGVCAACADNDICGNGIDDDCDGTPDNGSPETCNGEDDDCDGSVDEELDEDGDNFSWCPTGPPPQDCDDTNSAIHPAGAGTPVPDICDGLDNDCDPATPDGSGQCNALTQDCDGLGCVDVNCMTRPSLCVTGQFCDETTLPPSCQTTSMTCINGEAPCPEGTVCNPANAACVTPSGDGSRCDYDAECTSGLCVPVQALRAPELPPPARAGYCSHSCCRDSDCGSQERCWASGTGARACVPASFFVDTGFGAPAAMDCTTRSQCSQECVAGTDDAADVNTRYRLACGPGRSSRSTCFGDFTCQFEFLSSGAACVNDSCTLYDCGGPGDCPSGICGSGLCRETCAVAADCPRGGACVHWFFMGGDGSRRDYVPACSYATTGGGNGADCTADTDCLERTCVDETGDPVPDLGTPLHCASSCCSDAQCGDQQCRPIRVHGHWENHCLPRPIFGRVAMGG